MIQLQNTLSGKKENFKPIQDKKVGMYNCGPTVYNYAHIGNLRSYVFADILRRTLEWNNYEVTQVVNITDIGRLSDDGDTGEDKMTKGLKREGKPFTLSAMRELADFYTGKFLEDLSDLNIKKPSLLPKASEHVDEDIELIKKLEEKKNTYKTSDGIYFDTSTLKDYGKLGQINMESSESTSRIGINTEKKSSRDFALWKFNDNIGFPSPWGQGFPGWHIECSAMSMKYLGETFDIHTGGIDHIPVHHNNEIAQSESATGKLYARFWLHNAFVNIGEAKMAKSEGNFLRLQSLKDKGVSPIVYRYWLLGARYNTPMNFSWEALEGAKNAFENLKNKFLKLGNEIGKPNTDYLNKFTEYINDDLDTPKALSLVWEVLENKDLSSAEKKSTVLEFDKLLGFGLDKIKTKIENIPENIKLLATEREQARKDKNWEKSDDLRKEIEKLGYNIKDTESGSEISAK